MRSIGAFDQAIVYPGMTAKDALNSAIRLACDLENIGYNRIWFSEHHNDESTASVSPEILIGLALAASSTIHIGAGAILLQLHQPEKVFENFSTLRFLFNNRVELGVGRSLGNSKYRNRSHNDNFEEKIKYLIDEDMRLQSKVSSGSLYYNNISALLSIWCLGSGLSSAKIAGRLGLPYCHAHFFDPDMMDRALATYLESFHPSVYLNSPHVMICYTSVCALSKTNAQLTSLGMPHLRSDDHKTANDAIDRLFKKRFGDRHWIVGTIEEIQEAIIKSTNYLKMADIMVHSPGKEYLRRYESHKMIIDSMRYII